MKICAITKPRNESDIIESFCRYTLTYCECIYTSCLPSDDNTVQIIDNLIDEGLNIFKHYAYYKNELLDIAVRESGADLFLPLDPDEFYCTETGGNPRDILLRLDENKYYETKWRTYIYSGYGAPGGGTSFSPFCFCEYRDPSLEKFGKAIISRKLYEKYNPSGSPGFHSIVFPEEARVEALNPEGLVLAHFPVRNKTQMLIKVITGKIHNVLRNDANGFQYNNIYGKIRDTSDISDELMRRISLEYALQENEIPDNIRTVEGGLDADACQSSITMKYSSLYEDTHRLVLKTVLREFDRAFTRYHTIVNNNREEVDANLQEYEKNTLHDFTREELANSKALIVKLQNRIIQVNNNAHELNESLAKIHFSRAWKIAKVLSRVYSFFRGKHT